MPFDYGRYIPVATRRAAGRREVRRLARQGRTVQPVEISGRTIARSFWGRAWCGHLESFADYSNRLPRGRRYVRNGSVLHLQIGPHRVEALVNGSELYDVVIDIDPLPSRTWDAIRDRCAGEIDSMLDLLHGRLSHGVMAAVTHRHDGLLPLPGQIRFSCSCPDVASMCKHVAGALYGVGHRLDSQPERLFALRDVDPSVLLQTDLLAPVPEATDELEQGALADIFGVDLDLDLDDPPAAPVPTVAQGDRVFVPTGAGIRALRERAGLSRSAFARQLGVSGASITRWESIPGTVNLQSRPLNALRRFAASPPPAR